MIPEQECRSALESRFVFYQEQDPEATLRSVQEPIKDLRSNQIFCIDDC